MKTRSLFWTMLLAVSLSACSQNQAVNTASNMELTIAAAVVSQVAGLPSSTPVPTLTPEPPTATATVPSPTASKTTQESPTQLTSTVYPYITWTPSQCDKSAFMADLDIADYSFVYPGTNFTKTWRIKNIGTCTWTTKYRFQYISGNPMGADTIYLPKSVAPGDTIDISLNMRAPDIDEDYSNFWRLRNAAGEIFGTTFYVAIEVSKSRVSVTPSPTIKPATVTPTPTSTQLATATLVPTTEIPSETPVETVTE